MWAPSSHSTTATTPVSGIPRTTAGWSLGEERAVELFVRRRIGDARGRTGRPWRRGRARSSRAAASHRTTRRRRDATGSVTRAHGDSATDAGAVAQRGARRRSAAGPAGSPARPPGRGRPTATQVSSTMSAGHEVGGHADAEPPRGGPRRARTADICSVGHPARRTDHEGGRRDGVDEEEERQRVRLTPVGESASSPAARPGSPPAAARRRRQRRRVEPEVEDLHEPRPAHRPGCAAGAARTARALVRGAAECRRSGGGSSGTSPSTNTASTTSAPSWHEHSTHLGRRAAATEHLGPHRRRVRGRAAAGT